MGWERTRESVPRAYSPFTASKAKAMAARGMKKERKPTKEGRGSWAVVRSLR